MNNLQQNQLKKSRLEIFLDIYFLLISLEKDDLDEITSALQNCNQTYFT